MQHKSYFEALSREMKSLGKTKTALLHRIRRKLNSLGQNPRHFLQGRGRANMKRKTHILQFVTAVSNTEQDTKTYTQQTAQSRCSTRAELRDDPSPQGLLAALVVVPWPARPGALVWPDRASLSAVRPCPGVWSDCTSLSLRLLRPHVCV